MGQRLIKLLVVLGWLGLLLGPLLAAQIVDGEFQWDFPRFFKVMAICGVLGLAITLYQTFASKVGHLKPRIPSGLLKRVPAAVYWVAGGAAVLGFPWVTGRYGLDVGINVLIYIALGLGLNIVVGLAGLLDLGYIAFYAVGAYTYALLNVHYGVSFWLALPVGCIISALAGACIGYPTLKMRGDYLAIVTLGFGEIIRIVLNNWDSVTEGPNGILGIKAPGIFYPSMTDGSFHLEHLYLKDLTYLSQ